MENSDKLIKAFGDALSLPPEKINDTLEYGSQNWDSVAHMALIAALETEFDIMIETEDVIDLSGFQKAKEILLKYDVNL